MKDKLMPIIFVSFMAVITFYGLAYMIQGELADTLCVSNGWDYGQVDITFQRSCGYDYSLHPEVNGEIIDKPDLVVPFEDIGTYQFGDTLKKQEGDPDTTPPKGN